jgi:hypothetical protein
MVLPPANCQLCPISYMLILAPLESLIVGKGMGEYKRARKGETRHNNKQGRTTIYCNALFGISLFCSNADMNLLLGLSPVLISGYDTVNSKPKRWDVGSRILIILYPAHQLILLHTSGPSPRLLWDSRGESLTGLGLTRPSNLYENLLLDLISSRCRSNQ